MSDELMTAREVREHLRVSRTTVYRLVKAGRLAALHIGSRVVRYARSDVDRMIEESKNRRQ